jgi:hypothetical protein
MCSAQQAEVSAATFLCVWQQHMLSFFSSMQPCSTVGGQNTALQQGFSTVTSKNLPPNPRSLFLSMPHRCTRPTRRLDRVGYDVGCRILELLSYRERATRRKPEILDILKHIHSAAWPYMFGKTADDLQQANATDDEYMISDNDLLLGRFISIPKSYSSFVPGSLVAGIVRGMLDSAGFPAR